MEDYRICQTITAYPHITPRASPEPTQKQNNEAQNGEYMERQRSKLQLIELPEAKRNSQLGYQSCSRSMTANTG